MLTSIYEQGQHSPCEHYARIGYGHLAAGLTDADYVGWPEDTYEDDHPGSQDRWIDRVVLARLIGEEPAPKKRGPKEPDLEAREKPVALAGVTLGWHIGLPEMKVWAGQATLQTIVDGRREALHVAGDLPESVRLLDWTIPYPTMSGLDPRTAASAVDIGFSPAATKKPIHTYVAAELLMCIGLQLAPTIRYGQREYGYADPDAQDRWWRYTIVEREGYHRMVTMSSPTRSLIVA